MERMTGKNGLTSEIKNKERGLMKETRKIYMRKVKERGRERDRQTQTDKDRVRDG